MINKNSFILLVLILVCSPGCKESTEVSEVNEICRRFNISKDYPASSIILVPVSGCSSCIQPTLMFTMANSNRLNNTFFIITDFGDKRIEQYFGKEYERSANILSDSQGYIYKLEPGLTGPIIFFLKKGKLVEKSFINSSNDSIIFDRLLSSN